MFASGIEFLSSLDLPGLIGVFWFFFLFEVPRYTLSTLAVGWRAVFERELPLPPPDLPVSILMVGHNEGDVLERAVRALGEQTHRNLQIVVVEDGSTDDMARVGARLQAMGAIHRFMSTGIRGGKAAALNLGLQLCDNEIVVVMDVDTSLDRDAVARIVAPLLADPGCGAVSGNLAVRNPDDSLLTKFQAIDYVSSISLGRQFAAMFDILMIVSGAFGAFRQSAIRRVGGWDVGPGDDSNITTKLRRNGWSIAFAPAAWALTDVPQAHAAYVRQRLRWNRSIVRNRLRKFALVFDPRQGNFTLRDVVASLNVLWFQMGLTFAYFFFVIGLFIDYGSMAFSLIVAVHLLGIMGDLIEFSVALIVLRRLPVYRLFPYVLGFTFFVSYYDRAIRMVAYLSELIFRDSYKDGFYPTKVRHAQDQF